MNLKKIAKSISAVAMALVVGLSLASCGDDGGAKSYLEKELKKSQEIIGEVAKELKEGKTDKASSIPGLSQVLTLVSSDPEGLKTVGEFAGKMGEFDFKIEDIKESGDKATAKVKISTYDFKKILEEAQVELLPEAEKIVSEAATPKDGQTAVIVRMFKYVSEKAKDKSHEEEITIELKKEGKQWSVEPESLFKLTNATTGGLN